jgi:phosphoserine phosphatase
VTLPSWNDGDTRQRLLDFLEASTQVPPECRVAVFDNDGTLWCERPDYPQMAFFLQELGQAADRDPDLASRPEYDALLSGDQAAVAEMGLERLALALVEIFEGLEPAAFEDRVRQFFSTAVHPDKGVGYARLIYQPMLELIEALHERGFTVCIVTGGGTEFVRSVSDDLYGVSPERVVGTLVSYQMRRREDGRPFLVRAAQSVLDANEGATKVTNIQTALGRRPILAAGNSAGDREMMEYTTSSGFPSLALLVHHDDAEREYAYESRAQTFEEDEPITVTAHRLGWAVASMTRDWRRVFPD